MSFFVKIVSFAQKFELTVHELLHHDDDAIVFSLGGDSNTMGFVAVAAL